MTENLILQEYGTKEDIPNPKDIVGSNKIHFSAVPANVIAEVALGMTEGEQKYGRHNFRHIPVRASIYYDALLRHIIAWWEGEDIDPDSGLNHITKALCCLVVLRDCMMNEKWEDDRPPKSKPFIEEFNKLTEDILNRYPQRTHQD